MKHCSTIDASTIDARWRRKKGPSDRERHDGLASSRDSLCHPVLHPRPIRHGQLTKPIRHNLLNSVSFGPQLQSSVDSDIGDRAALLPSTAGNSIIIHKIYSLICIFHLRFGVTLWTVMITSRWHITWLAGQRDCSASLGERDQLVAVTTCCSTNEGRDGRINKF